VSKSGKDIMIGKVREKLNTTIKGAQDAIDAVIESIADMLTEDDRIEIRGFGTFSVKRKKERMGRNPKTGAPIKIKAKNGLSFKASKIIQDRLN